ARRRAQGSPEWDATVDEIVERLVDPITAADRLLESRSTTCSWRLLAAARTLSGGSGRGRWGLPRSRNRPFSAAVVAAGAVETALRCTLESRTSSSQPARRTPRSRLMTSSSGPFSLGEG